MKREEKFDGEAAALTPLNREGGGWGESPEAGGPPRAGTGTRFLTRPALCLATTRPRPALEGGSAVVLCLHSPQEHCPCLSSQRPARQ